MYQNKRPLHIIMPMAGEGSRFMKEGWTTPKPLIKLNGRELFLHAIDSIDISGIIVPELVSLNTKKKNPHTINVPKIEKDTNFAILKNLLFNEANE